MLSKLFTITCAVFATLAVSATCETQVEVREVAGSLSFLVHSLELNKKMEYCVLTPHDDTNSELIVIDTEHSPEMLAQCEQGAEGLFTIAQSGTSSKKMDKSGCDSRFASLCVPAAYEVVQSQRFQFGDGKKHNKAAADKVVGARSALIIQMDYLDKTPDCPMSCLQQSMWGSTYNVDGLYSEASYGNLRFSQSASTVVQLKMSSRVSDYDYCSNGPQKIRTDALAALSTQYPSIVPGNYNHMIMSSPALCGVAVSQVGGTLVWMNSNAQDVLGHELGHNLGRRHASLDTSDDDPSTQSSYSTDQDYGDLSCVMGYSGVGLRSFTVPARFALGWIPSSSIAVPPATCSNTAVQYTLASGQLPADNSYGYHAVQIPRAKGGKYYVSFRAGAGYDVNAPTGWKNAVFVHYVVATSTRTKFVAALTAGQSYSDSMTGFRVTVVGTGSNSATVSIVCGATVGNCDMKLVSGLSSIAGQFARSSSTINGTSAWARSDLRAVIAYCGTKSLWVVGTHDGSAVTNFSPCSSIMYKSSSSSQASPTDSDTWYTCSSSSCSTDSSAALTVTSCTQVAVVANPSSSPSPSPSPSPSSSSSRSRSFSSSPSTSPSPVAVASSSSSPSRTSSASTSRSPSASVTPSASITPSSATSSSSSPSPSPSPSTSSSTSATPNTSSNSSPTRTATASVSTSASASKSRTPSTSFSRSSTSSVSSSKSTSATKSATKSRSASPSSSRSSSASRSGSVSSSASASSSRAPPAAKSMVENLAVITALDASTTPVCPYFESLCDKCAEVPSAICVYLTDLCLKCT